MDSVCGADVCGAVRAGDASFLSCGPTGEVAVADFLFAAVFFFVGVFFAASLGAEDPVTEACPEEAFELGVVLLAASLLAGAFFFAFVCFEVLVAGAGTVVVPVFDISKIA